MSLAVLKFGGTSVGDANAIRQSAAIVRDASAQFDRIIVVTSAMGKSPDPRDTIKVTDVLLEAAKTSASGDGESFHKARRLLADKHHIALNALVTNSDDRRRIGEEIDQLLDGFEMLCASVRVLGEVTPRALDAIAGLGDRMAAGPQIGHHDLPHGAVILDDQDSSHPSTLERPATRTPARHLTSC